VLQNLIGIGLSVIGCECVSCLTSSFLAAVTLFGYLHDLEQVRRDSAVTVEVEVDKIVKNAYNSPAQFFLKLPKPWVYEVMECRGYLLEGLGRRNQLPEAEVKQTCTLFENTNDRTIIAFHTASQEFKYSTAINTGRYR
jgi:hypothetical protein